MKSQKGQKSKEELSAIEKIRKLMEFSVENGATESEVENAMKLAQRLMMKHNLEQGDIEIGIKDINFTEVHSTWKDGMEAKSFELKLLQTLGKIYSCRIITQEHRIKDYYLVVGLPEDRDMTVTAYHSVLPQIRSITKRRFKESDRRLSLFRYTTSYQTGFLQGLEQKLKSDKETFFTEEEKESWGLIIVKKDDLIDEYVEETMNIKTFKIKKSTLDDKAYFTGLEDGSEKGLNKQLGK